MQSPGASGRLLAPAPPAAASYPLAALDTVGG